MPFFSKRYSNIKNPQRGLFLRNNDKVTGENMSSLSLSQHKLYYKSLLKRCEIPGVHAHMSPRKTNAKTFFLKLTSFFGTKTYFENNQTSLDQDLFSKIIMSFFPKHEIFLGGHDTMARLFQTVSLLMNIKSNYPLLYLLPQISKRPIHKPNSDFIGFISFETC